ncbi:MAG TPA: DUF899 domain-containing protein [Polyangiaceae bacterium]|nr:DUF899 domain-containing protein [Polyangiaceae bacterium]
MTDHPITSQEQWLAARRELLTKEKQFTQLRDQLSEQRRQLPWVKVERAYTFQGANGPETLAQLFEGRHQLIVYHLMFAPENERACKNCSFWADHFDGIEAHLKQRDTTFAAISRAPLPKLQRMAQELGWRFKWLSCGENGFNHDFGTSFTPEERATGSIDYNFGKFPAYGADMPGISVFFRDGEQVFHTYSTYARGIDLLNTTYNYLDLTPQGRDEGSQPMSWVQHRDRYGH